jgi:hypothetical protein
MQYIGKSKIGKLSAKGIAYPQLRLPQKYSDTIGKIANLFETEHEGKRAFLIVTEQSVSKKRHGFKTEPRSFKTCRRTSS